jgi:hypothetical protein
MCMYCCLHTLHPPPIVIGCRSYEECNTDDRGEEDWMKYRVDEMTKLLKTVARLWLVRSKTRRKKKRTIQVRTIHVRLICVAGGE